MKSALAYDRERCIKTARETPHKNLSTRKELYEKNLNRLKSREPKLEELVEYDYEIKTYELALSIIYERESRARTKSILWAIYAVLAVFVSICGAIVLAYFLLIKVIVPYWDVVWFGTLHLSYTAVAVVWIKECIEVCKRSGKDALIGAITGLVCNTLWFLFGIWIVASWREDHRKTYYDKELEERIHIYPVMGIYFYLFVLNNVLVFLSFIVLIVYTLSRKIYHETYIV